MITLIAGACIASFGGDANGVLVAVISISFCTLIFTDTSAFPVASVETTLTLARALLTDRILELCTVGVFVASLRCRFLHNRLRGWGAVSETVSDKVVIASANWHIVRVHLAACIFMANNTNARVLWNALERALFNWHVVRHVASIGKNGIVARKTTTFESLWRVVVDTE
jgi:hypothetical protein